MHCSHNTSAANRETQLLNVTLPCAVQAIVIELSIWAEVEVIAGDFRR